MIPGLLRKFSLTLIATTLAAAGVLALFTLLHTEAQAAPVAECRWTGPQDAVARPWSNVAYWDCGKVPGPGDTAIIDGGFRVVSIDAPVTVHKLVLFDGGSGSGIHGYHTLTVTGQMDWDGAIVGSGHLSPTGAAETVVIAPGALMRLTRPGGDNRLLQGRIVNYGTIEHTDGKWLRNYYGVIDNRPGGVYRLGGGRIEQNTIYASPDDSGWFENAGTIIKEGADTFTLHMALTNSGQVSVTGGTLVVNLTSSAQVVTHTGAFAVAAPGVLELGSYEHRFGPSSAISGDGVWRMSNGADAVVGGAYTLSGLTDLIGGAGLYLDTASGAVSLPVIQMGGSTRLGGSSAITVTQALTMSNALLVNGSNGVSDTVNIAPGATLWVQDSGLSGRTLNNHGAVTLASGGQFWMEHGAVFNNHPTGVFTVTQGDMRPQYEWSDCVLNNAGRIVKLDPGDFKKWYNISLNNTGSIEVWDGGFSADGPFRQTAGEVFLNGGTLRNTTENLVFNGGRLRGNGTISLVNEYRLENNGAILQPTDILMIDRGYRQGAGGALQIDIGGLAPGAGYGVLQVAGDAALDGRLILSPTHGFQPAAGDLFQMLTYNSRSGEFAQVERGLGLAFGPEYQASGVVVSDNPTLVEFSQRPDRRVLPPGGAGGFSLRLTNTYSATVSAAFQDSLTAGLNFVPGSATSNRPLAQPAVTLVNGDQLLTWPDLEIAAGEVVTIHFGVAATATVGVYTNTAQAEVTPAGGDPRTLRLVEQVDVARSPTHDTVLQISPGVAYPPVEPDGLWTVAMRRGTPSSVVSVTITSTPVCSLPACGPLKRFYALHDGRTFTLTLVPDTTDRYRAEIPQGQFNLNERIFLVTVFQSAAGQTLRQLSSVQAGGECSRVGGTGGGYYYYDSDDGLVPCTPATERPKFFDPSGYVTDARTGAPVVGATVTLYRVGAAWPDTRSTTRDCRTVDTRPGGVGGTWGALPPAAPGTGVAEDPLFAPAAMDPAINPQKTDAAGHYGWDVVQGCWYVLVEAPGYYSKSSAVVGVPPEVTDLDLALTPWPRLYLPLMVR